MKNIFLFITLLIVVVGCSPSKQLKKAADEDVLNNPALRMAHVGISIFEPSIGKYWFNYQGDKYFVPASNTKLATCYAAMKYLGDSIAGIRYERAGDDVYLEPTADPSFLLPEFRRQPVYDFLKSTKGRIILSIGKWNDKAWGSGWSWNDYSEYYMAERSPMPIYGNVTRFSNKLSELTVIPRIFFEKVMRDSTEDWNVYPSSVQRKITANEFLVTGKSKTPTAIETPIYTNNGEVIFLLLPDTLHMPLLKDWMFEQGKNSNLSVIRSQATDSILKPMMHRSDNFFAEQSLLMVSNELFGEMNDAITIDTILKTDFKDLPQKPHWVDGSGLSRYNLFSPQDLVAILDKMQKEFGIDRIKNILPTGNEGTLKDYYKADSGYLFCKTGTLSGVVALSGLMYTRKNKLLIFSILVNNHQSSATDIRRAVEKFIESIRNRW